MAKGVMEAKIRPLANPSLEKNSLAGAARVYVSKDALLSMVGSVENGRPCFLERGRCGDSPPLKRQATLWSLIGKDVSPNVVLMARAFQEACGFKLGDVVCITLGDASVPSADVVVLREVTEPNSTPPLEQRHRPCWEFPTSH